MPILRRFHLSTFVGALALVAVAFPVVVAVGLYHLNSASRDFSDAAVLRAAQRANAELLKLQIDEETGLRGFIVTGHRLYLDPYEQAQRRFPAVQAELQRGLEQSGILPELRGPYQELLSTHAAWIAQVATPILRSGTTVARQRTGKAYIDRFRAANASIDQTVNVGAAKLRDRAQQDLSRGVALFASAIVLFIGAAVMLVASQRRLRSDLERERGIVASLQRAFVSRHQVVPSVDVGVAYRSATEGTFVGGDVFDVSLLTDKRALIMVADVSGKGVGAAVETAFVKYAIRALARATASPAEILRQLNQMYGQDADRWGSGSFIVLFLAILDLQTHELRYASAGHGSAFLRRGAAVQTLAVTGPALGIIDDAGYAEERLELRPLDALLVVTDGLTESRDGRGALLTEDGVADWFSHSSRSASAQTVVDAMLERAFERAGGHIGDDLAVVCARVTESGERPAARRVILSPPRLPSPR